MKAAKLFFILLCLAALIAPAAAAGGAGTAANPYVIQTPAELQSIQNNLAAYYVLGNDIDMSGYSFTPIGSESAPFTGSLNGDDYTIKNLVLSSTSKNTGLFKVISSGAVVKDMTFRDCSISSTSYRVGIITGLVLMSSTNNNKATISNVNFLRCNIFSNMHSVGCIAGLVYTASNIEIVNCKVNYCTIEASGNAGGFIGECASSPLTEIINCDVLNTHITTFNNDAAFFVGRCNANSVLNVEYSNIDNSILEGVNEIGGINGICSSSSFINAVNCNMINSIIKGSNYIGGLFGINYGNLIESSNCIVSNCNIIGTDYYVGGIVATIYSAGIFLNCEVSDCVIYAGKYASGIGSYFPVDSTIPITQSIVKNTNIYSPSTTYDIGPSGSYDSTSTATGITHVSNRYLYASGLSYTTSGTTATLTLDDRQGAAVIQTDTGAAAAMTWDYGDGTTETDTDSTQTHTYANGIYSAGVVMSSYLATTEQAFYTTPINIGIPTYTANTVTTQDADIVIDAGQLYQAELQYVLPGTNTDLEFFADNLFIIASGNAVYSVDTATQEITPVSTTTGTTANKIYLGENSAVITDINGNTAVYQYEENSFDYLASGNSQQIATTGNYAGVLLNGKLNIYDLTEPRKIGDVTASVSQLAANDYADTFAGFTGTTLNYWWIDNGEIKSGSQTLTNTITAIKQIPQTQNYILTTTKNTVIVGISATGTYSLVSTSDTELPLTHPQATTIGVVIGVHAPNEIYIVGADGSTAGTYQTGAALNDASITKATGLYAITGGNDQQAYILSKDQSSTWILAQTIKANGAISHTQISTTGGYAAIVSGVNLYLLKISTTTENNYYLNGIVIDSNSLPYNGEITINGEKVHTDKSGKFTYSITPGTLYQINAKGTIIEYTATNAALQQIAIRIKAGLLSTDVTYSADYNAESQAIIMSYDDSAGKTTAVTWKVYETANNTLVATYTGNTASYPIEAGDVYNNYYVQLSADRGAATVTNTWSITPAGGQPVDLYGLDEDGRNIIFGFLLLLLAGLFGVMHSRSGAIIVAFAACIMRYLELITIPWILIIIAAVLAIVAAIAHGGLNR